MPDINPINELAKAWEQNKEKLATFSTGDRVTKPWFSYFTGATGVVNGIFIEPRPPVDCMVLWEGKTEPELETVSFIRHA